MVQPLNPLDALLRRCTVRIDQRSGHGTGFFVAPGLIVTCAHAVEDAQDTQMPIPVYWQQQTYQPQIVEYLARPYPDLALLRVELYPHPCVYLCAEVRLGDELYSFGYSDLHPDGDSVTLEYEGPIGAVAK